MFIIYLHVKYLAFSSSSPLVIAVSQKARHSIFHSYHSLYYIEQKRLLKKVAHSLKVYLHTKFEGPLLNGTSVAATSKIHD